MLPPCANYGSLHYPIDELDAWEKRNTVPYVWTLTRTESDYAR
jgi:hypothetical protein